MKNTAAWFVFCLTLFSGCALQPTRVASTEKSPVREMPAPDSVETLLKFAQAYAALPADAQKREYTRLTGQRKTEVSRMQLALIASAGGSRYRDLARAQALLDEHLKAADSKDEGIRTLAWLLKAHVTEQQKTEDALLAMGQKVKDEQKKSDSLQRKLDELLAVEKTMNERNQRHRK